MGGLWVHLGVETGQRWAWDEGWRGIKVPKKNTFGPCFWERLSSSPVPSLPVAPAFTGWENPSRVPTCLVVAPPCPPPHLGGSLPLGFGQLSASRVLCL